jgi:hypothetical protein
MSLDSKDATRHQPVSPSKEGASRNQEGIAPSYRRSRRSMDYPIRMANTGRHLLSSDQPSMCCHYEIIQVDGYSPAEGFTAEVWIDANLLLSMYYDES